MTVQYEGNPSLPVIALVGPTAVGKSEFALALGERLSLEIVNADSRQVYRYMDIGTSKPTVDDRQRVSHHLLDVVEPDEEFSLALYLRMARSACQSIAARGRVPLIVGGTGQYIWSLVEGWQVPEVPPDLEFRRDMEEMASRFGAASLHAELTRVDAEAGKRIQPGNVRRVIRAMELHRATGQKPSDVLWRKEGSTSATHVIGLALERPTLVAKADARIDRMIQHGFIDEVRWLLDHGYGPSLPAMSSIGYREIAEHVLGRCDRDATVARIRKETRRLIRRQQSWFRPSDERIRWLDWRYRDIAIEEAVRVIEGGVT